MNLKKYTLTILLAIFTLLETLAQSGEIRGFVYDKTSAEPLAFTTVYIQGTQNVAITDLTGFFTLTKIKPGNYTLLATSLGYDTASYSFSITDKKIVNHSFYLQKSSVQLKEVNVSAEKQKQQTQIEISKVTITQRDLKLIPTVGGEPDLIQYLQVLPGVVFSGDQGGQLYIRGGPPIQNKMLLDGMVIYNPFHSIGLFSVYDADIIRSADVYAGGFNTQYGGRISAVVDVQTREGNKVKTGGKVSANPFTSKVLLEGPLKKYVEGEGTASYILSYKNSYLDQSSKLFYTHADSNGLPYRFSDFYGKISFVSPNGSKTNLFGFNFTDNTRFATTTYGWKAFGMGANFSIIPEGSSTLINAVVAYSRYGMEQTEVVEAIPQPRTSDISGFNASLNFTYFIGKDDMKYGIELEGFKTDFATLSNGGRAVNQLENTTQIAAYFKYKKTIRRFLIEPGIRFNYYASLGNTALEPRIGVKWNASSTVRIKAAAGLYSQNLIAAVSDRDVVNLFYGFLSAPDNLPNSFKGNPIENKLQWSRQTVIGAEIEVGKNGLINVEGFWKYYPQLVNINRDKIYDDIPANQDKPAYLRTDYIVETGNAYGGDISYRWEYKNFYLWTVYSLTFVDRTDELRTYFPSFDRRHNANIVTSYTFGKDKRYTANLRWNLASGFPFTRTQGYYPQIGIGGVSDDYTNQNGNLGIFYDDINKGRLPYYHRLDASIEKRINVKKGKLSVIASATNVYNRDNIFYFERVTNRRINQLPIMPSLGINYTF